MQCEYSDQVKRDCMATAFTVMMSWLAGALFGFAIAIIADFQLTDRVTLGVAVLVMSGIICSALSCSLYISKIQPSDEF